MTKLSPLFPFRHLPLLKYLMSDDRDGGKQDELQRSSSVIEGLKPALSVCFLEAPGFSEN